MTTAEQLYHELEALPDALKQEALNYIGYLKEKYRQQSAEIQTNNNNNTKSKQQLAYEWMNEMASQPHSFNGIDAVKWQKQQREDKVLSGRSY